MRHRQPLRDRIQLWLVIGCLFASCVRVFAHDPGLSSANLEIGERAVTLLLTFNERDIAGLVADSAEELRAGTAPMRSKLEALAHRAVVMKFDGQPQSAAAVVTRTDGENNVEFQYTFSSLPQARELIFESALMQELSFGHRQAFAAFAPGGTGIARQILSAREKVARMSLQSASEMDVSSRGTSRFLEFFLLGIRHIVTGYDHLLFLFGLLIVCRGIRSALLLITCFTLAHSLTLVLSTFGLVNLPSRWVEAIIAASILYVGIENLVRRDGILRGRWLLTFVFGLIHGLGFAGVLHELGIAQSGKAALLPLVAFNSGVEAGQLAIAAVVLPIIWKLRERPAFLRVGVPACSIIVAAAGAYWLMERTVLS